MTVMWVKTKIFRPC